MKRTYEVTEQADKRAVAEFLKREGQFLLPMVELVERAELAIDEVIEVMGRATIEAVLDMSAEALAGPKQAGKARENGRAGWYGRQSGQVYLAERKVHVERPRLRTKGQGEGGELEVPAYLAMQRPGPLADRMLEILLAGVSTRRYAEVIPEMADTVGVSKSAVSRETIEASERVLSDLMERRLDAWDLLVVYLDGIQFGAYHVLAAVGVDTDGVKHVLGVREGASENAEVTKALLEDLIARGLDPARRRLWVIDGSKALRKAIDQVFGPQPVQRCRNHKLRNILRPPAEGPAPAGEGGVPGGHEAGGEGRRAEARAARPVAGARPSLRRGQPAGGPLRAVHDQPARPAPAPEEVPGHDQPHRQHPLGRQAEDPQGDELEERSHGAQVGRGHLRRDREELPQIIGHDQLWMLKAHLDDLEPVAEMKKAG